jgi:DNA-binding MarR family transcriptional regulator
MDHTINTQVRGAQAGAGQLSKVWRVIEEFRKLDPELPSQTINTFMYVAMHEGCTMKQLSEALGVAQSTMSRNVSALSKLHRLGKPGLDVVKSEIDPYERRRRIVTLTPRGRKLLAEVSSILEG